MRRHRITCVLLALTLESLAGCGGSGREPEGEARSAHSPGPPAPLAAGSHPAESLSPGSTRSYALSLQTGQYLQLVVEQLGVDVAVRLLDPAGHLLLRVDSPNAKQGPEELLLVTGTAGRHLLEIEASAGTGRYEVRVEALRKATPEDRTRAAAAAAYSRARLLDRGGQRVSAGASYREAARLWNAAGDVSNEAWSRFRLGSLFVDDPARRREAIESLDLALSLYRRVGDRHQEAMTLYFLGRAWGETDEVERTSRSYEQALALWKDLGGGLFDEATWLNDLAIVRVRQGRLQDASGLYSQAVGVWQRQGNGRHEATTRTNLGFLYAYLGEGRLALGQYRRSLALLDVQPEAASTAAQRAVTLNKLGDALLWMEGPEPALARLREALELRRQQHDISGQAVTLNSIGLAQLAADRPREALEAFRSAGGIFRLRGDGPAQAVVLNNLGIAYERLGYPAQARESFERGLALGPDGAGAMAAIFGLARVERSEGRLDEAERRMEQILELVEGVRSQIWRPDLRASYQSTRQEQYAFLIDLLAERHRREPGRGHAARAFAFSERARARSLLDLLSAARARPDSAEIRRLRNLSRRINARHLDLLTSPREVANMPLELKLAALLESWRQASAETQGPPPAAAASLSLQEAQRLLDEDTLLLEYFLGEDRSYVWAVTSTAVRFVSTLPGRERIEAASRQAYDRITRSHFQTEEVAARQAAALLSRMVLGPVADLLDRPRLVIVA
ncbi:MAG TPA: tetratricopeptide repeat protein, partial [Thermoanaerobaculia bacterium]|nr:tetratricopeptide repeat protein [Thermoanaerobaculia bacterium]